MWNVEVEYAYILYIYSYTEHTSGKLTIWYYSVTVINSPTIVINFVLWLSQRKFMITTYNAFHNFWGIYFVGLYSIFHLYRLLLLCTHYSITSLTLGAASQHINIKVGISAVFYVNHDFHFWFLLSVLLQRTKWHVCYIVWRGKTEIDE